MNNNERKKWCVVSIGGVGVRNQPSTNGDKIGRLPYAKVIIGIEKNGWVQHDAGWSIAKFNGQNVLKPWQFNHDILKKQDSLIKKWWMSESDYHKVGISLMRDWLEMMNDDLASIIFQYSKEEIIPQYNEAFNPKTVKIDPNLQSQKINDLKIENFAYFLSTDALLTCLYIDRNNIGDVGAVAIGKALAKNATLQQLRLANNKIGNLGATAIGISLSENKTLNYLDLDRNCIGDEGASVIGSKLSDNSTLKELSLVGIKCSEASEWLLLGKKRQRKPGCYFTFILK